MIRKGIQSQISYKKGSEIVKQPIIDLLQIRRDSILEIRQETVYLDGTESLVVEIIVPAIKTQEPIAPKEKPMKTKGKK